MSSQRNLVEPTEKIMFQEICASYESLIKRDEKDSVMFLLFLKLLKTQKELHHCLTTFKVFNTEKRTPSLSYDL